jgi:hypothetical protein
MEEFYIDVQLSLGTARLQVDEVPPEQWDMPFTPQFIIEFYNGRKFITLTLQLLHGKWYDRNSLLSDGDWHLQYFEADPNPCNSDYQSPLYQEEIDEIGQAISRHMIVMLSTYMGLFVPVFPKPEVN